MSSYADYIKKYPIESGYVLACSSIALFEQLVDDSADSQIKILGDLFKNTGGIPVDYLNAFRDGRISEKDFKIIVSEAHSNLADVFSWPEFTFLLKLHQELGGKDFKKTVRCIEKDLIYPPNMSHCYKFYFEFDGDKIVNNKHSISAKRLLTLLHLDGDKILPILNMSGSEALYVFGTPNSTKEDVMKTKTVETWVYKAKSNKQDRQIKALELKFENDGLTRYIDNRDETNFENINLKRLELDGEDRDVCDLVLDDDGYDFFDCIVQLINAIEYIAECNVDREEIDAQHQKSIDELLPLLKRAMIQMDSILKGEIESAGSFGLSVRKMLFKRMNNESSGAIKKLEDLDSSFFDEEMNDLFQEINQSHKTCSNIEQYGQKTKPGCFIATATMGDYNNPIVKDLRIFRDTFLQKSYFGREFIKIYYKFGPYPAKLIAKSLILRKISYFLIIRPLYFATNLLMKR